MADFYPEVYSMVRLATTDDAEQLKSLNKEFNGPDNITVTQIRDSILNNRQEIVLVDDENGSLTGFVCIQLKKSFCYKEYMPEITEVYVREKHRKRGIATKMISFAEEYCSQKYPLHSFELLTGTNNLQAQSVYSKLGYARDGELHMAKHPGRLNIHCESDIIISENEKDI